MGADDVTDDFTHLGFLCLQVGLNATLPQHHNPVGYFEHIVKAMTDQDDGNALLLHLANELENTFNFPHGKGGSRFIHNDEFRIERECACNGDGLLLAARKHSDWPVNGRNAGTETGDHLQLAGSIPEVSLLMAEVQEEGLRVMEAAGIPLAEGNSPLDVFAMTQKARQIGESAPDDEAIRAAENLPEQERTYVSTWADLQQQRGETEASYLNGEILLLGEKYHVPTPYNFTLLDVVERMAVQQLPPGHYSISELRQMIERREETPISE